MSAQMTAKPEADQFDPLACDVLVNFFVRVSCECALFFLVFICVSFGLPLSGGCTHPWRWHVAHVREDVLNTDSVKKLDQRSGTCGLPKHRVDTG